MKYRYFIFAILLSLLVFTTECLLAQDDPILVRAWAGIRQHRMGDLIIKVVDSEGQSVPGVEVSVKMLRHQFLFGSNIFMWGQFERSQDEKTYTELFADLFNYATLPFYWGDYERERGKPDHGYREQVARWCQQHGIVAKGHPLIWTYPGLVPKWLPDNPEETRRLAANRVFDCVSRFKGLIDIWDVVNEAVDPYASNDPLSPKNNRLEKAFHSVGTVRMVKNMFAAARAANPGAKLLINDRLEPQYPDLLNFLRDDGKPIYDCIGIQSHMHDGAWSSRKLWDACEAYGRVGVPLHFTETTIVSSRRIGPGENWGPSIAELEEKQAEEAVRFYIILFGHPAVEAITWWDFADQGAWQRAAAGFLRKDLSRKPIYYSLQKLIREDWWTKVVLKTDDLGIARIRGFFGDYQIRAEKNGFFSSKKIIHDRKGHETPIGLMLIEKY